MDFDVYYTGGGIWIAEAKLGNGQYYSVDSFMDGLNFFNPPPSGREEDKYMPEDMAWSKGEDDLSKSEKELYSLLCHMIKYEEENF